MPTTVNSSGPTGESEWKNNFVDALDHLTLPLSVKPLGIPRRLDLSVLAFPQFSDPKKAITNKDLDQERILSLYAATSQEKLEISDRISIITKKCIEPLRFFVH